MSDARDLRDNDTLVSDLLAAATRFGGTGYVDDPMRETYRQRMVQAKVEVLRRLRAASEPHQSERTESDDAERWRAGPLFPDGMLAVINAIQATYPHREAQELIGALRERLRSRTEREAGR